MRMENDDSGFAVIEQVKVLGISSVVIILTANDSSIDCRKAFKMGAWDYISKNWQGNVIEMVNQSIQDAITYFNRWGNPKNEQWIRENIENLEQQYWGQWIAVINQTVIESAYSEEELNQKIEERKLRRFLTTIKKIGDLRPITEIIQLGESKTLEFKSTLQWDVRQQQKNGKLTLSVLKVIASFLNTEGGILIIGVEDDGNIFGLEKDLSLLAKRKDIDEFERKMVDLIKDNIGINFTQFIRIRFETIEDKIICVIDVKKANKCAFLKIDDKIVFYIRSGNRSDPVGIPQIYDYL